MAKESENTAAKTDLEKQLHDLRKDVAAITSTLTELGSKKLHDAKGRAQSMYGRARTQGDELLSDARNKLNETQETVCEYVHEKPITSLAIAAGVGFILGQILRR